MVTTYTPDEIRWSIKFHSHFLRNPLISTKRPPTQVGGFTAGGLNRRLKEERLKVSGLDRPAAKAVAFGEAKSPAWKINPMCKDPPIPQRRGQYCELIGLR